MTYPFNSQIVITGRCYNMKIFETSNGKQGLSFSIKLHANKLTKFYNAVVFFEASELFNTMTKGQICTVFGRLSLSEYKDVVSTSIFADKVIPHTADKISDNNEPVPEGDDDGDLAF